MKMVGEFSLLRLRGGGVYNYSFSEEDITKPRKTATPTEQRAETRGKKARKVCQDLYGPKDPKTGSLNIRDDKG